MLKFKIINQFLLISFLIIFCPNCGRRRERIVKKVDLRQKRINDVKIDELKADNQINEQKVTIWVHGTCLFPRLFLNKSFNSDPGLTKAQSVTPNYYLKTIAESISVGAPMDYPFEAFYIFGWSGGMNNRERKEAAKNLYLSIIEIFECYKLQNKIPKITIITHSHGGNVALNLAKLNKNNNNVFIEKLIMLACPVQNKTKENVKNPFFKKIYSFYSTMDFLQVLDPQGFHKKKNCQKKSSLFSQRCFDYCTNLKQIQIKLNDRGILHSEFLTVNFLKILPDIIAEIDSSTNSSSEFLLNIHMS